MTTGVTSVVSAAPDGSPGDSYSIDPTISADGSTVAFVSYASDVVTSLGAAGAVVVRDLVGGISTALLADPIANESSQLSISGDGGVVAFVTQEAIDPADTDEGYDVYITDRAAGTTLSPTLGSIYADRPQVSEDGRHVLFRSGRGLVPEATAPQVQAYVHDLLLGRTTLVSARTDGLEPDFGSDTGFGSISADGRLVVFWSRASDLVAPDDDSSYEVFLRRLPVSVV